MLSRIYMQSGCKITRIWPKLYKHDKKTSAMVACAHAQSAKWQDNGGTVQNDIFPIPIYEFNIYLFFNKKVRQLLERDAS